MTIKEMQVLLILSRYKRRGEITRQHIFELMRGQCDNKVYLDEILLKMGEEGFIRNLNEGFQIMDKGRRALTEQLDSLMLAPNVRLTVKADSEASKKFPVKRQAISAMFPIYGAKRK